MPGQPHVGKQKIIGAKIMPTEPETERLVDVQLMDISQGTEGEDHAGCKAAALTNSAPLKPSGLVSCWPDPAPAAVSSMTSARRVKTTGAKRKC